MTNFITHTIESAPEGSKAILQGAQDALKLYPTSMRLWLKHLHCLKGIQYWQVSLTKPTLVRRNVKSFL
jgi:hypothetical protein